MSQVDIEGIHIGVHVVRFHYTSDLIDSLAENVALLASSSHHDLVFVFTEAYSLDSDYLTQNTSYITIDAVDLGHHFQVMNSGEQVETSTLVTIKSVSIRSFQLSSLESTSQCLTSHTVDLTVATPVVDFPSGLVQQIALELP